MKFISLTQAWESSGIGICLILQEFLQISVSFKVFFKLECFPFQAFPKFPANVDQTILMPAYCFYKILKSKAHFTNYFRLQILGFLILHCPMEFSLKCTLMLIPQLWWSFLLILLFWLTLFYLVSCISVKPSLLIFNGRWSG